MAKKRRTAAQIRATKKLVAMNKARARKNSAKPKKGKGRSKTARQMKRAGKALAKWVRSGMPSQRNKAKRKTQCNPKTLKPGTGLYKAARAFAKQAGLKSATFRKGPGGQVLVTGRR